MTQDYDADVVIVGYGPTGLIAALTLARRGIRVMAFERHESIYPRARAVTVNDWTMRIFQDLGVDRRIEEVIEPQRGVRWVTYDGREVMRVLPQPSPLGAKARSYNIYQPSMEAELRRCVVDGYDDLVDVRYGTEVTGVAQSEDAVEVSYTDRDGGRGVVRSRYAIAADGGSSTVRGLLGIPLLGDTVDTTWIVIDCHVRRWWPERDILTFWTDRERPVVDIALSAGNHRWEIPLKPDESPADYPTAAEVWPLLKALGHDERDVEIHQYAFYKHHVRMAETWRQGRIFLAGDAAHLMPPWAGAGMQSGIRDAHNLGWKLARVLSGELDGAWLDTYEQERRPNAEFFTTYAVRLGRVIKQEATQEEIDELNTTPDGRLQPSQSERFLPPVLTDGWFRGAPDETSAVGRMIPQPVVSDATGRITRLDDLLGDGFVLLGADVDPTAVLTAVEKEQWDAMGARYVTLRPRTCYSDDPDDLVDLDGVLLSWMAQYAARVIALRPDRFVAAADLSGLATPDLAVPVRADQEIRTETHMALTADDLRKTVQTKDWKLTYYEAGAEHERTVILLHGSGPGATAWSNFAGNIEALATSLHVYAVDMPGWGDSDAVTVEGLDHVEAAIQFMDELEIEKAAFVGNSMGGQTALRLATEYPERVTHLVTMGAPPGRVPVLFGATDGPSEGLKILVEAYQDPSPEGMRRLVEVMTYDKARYATPELTKARSDAALARPDHLKNYLDGRAKGFPVPVWVDQAKLAQIQAPALLIHGRDDRVVSYENTLYLLSRIPDSTAVIWSHCGHWAMIEHAERFNRLVADFVLNN